MLHPEIGQQQPEKVGGRIGIVDYHRGLLRHGGRWAERRSEGGTDGGVHVRHNGPADGSGHADGGSDGYVSAGNEVKGRDADIDRHIGQAGEDLAPNRLLGDHGSAGGSGIAEKVVKLVCGQSGRSEQPVDILQRGTIRIRKDRIGRIG